ncbi:phosphatase domain-containing protein [Erythrobacter crassostreae]|uniref:phosphatase domain-containing protein n=1 Tax=Erythrobacter crassostreae TaxID=2828328 RepID=UPI0034E27852
MQPFLGYRNSEQLFLTVRALRSEQAAFDKRGFFANVRTMLRQYASHEVSGLQVRLTFKTGAGDKVAKNATTDDEGFAHFSVKLDPGYERPLNSAWERASVEWQGDDGAQKDCDAFILTPGRNAGVGIISDIDDTIMETGITGSAKAILRNWQRVVAQMPDERSVVPGAPGFYSALGGSNSSEPDGGNQQGIPQALPRPVFYVSSSPWNLFSYLVTFKKMRELPLGPIALRDWGFNRKTLGSEGHGSHKQVAIERILSAYPDLQFVLVGDDTQKDMVVFGKIGAEYPDRIAAVFIRKISCDPLNEAELNAKAALDQAKVPFWTGADYASAHGFLEQTGLEFDGRVEALVQTASEGSAPENKAPLSATAKI